MIVLPRGFTPVPNYPGYFWHLEEQVLYSIKIGGELKKLKLREINYFSGGLRRFVRDGDFYYRVSRNSRPRYLFLNELKQLSLQDHEIGYKDD